MAKPVLTEPAPGLRPTPGPNRTTTRRASALLLAVLLVAAVTVRMHAARDTPLFIPGYNEAASRVYIEVARNFLVGEGWVWNDRPASQHPPGYSLVLAGLIALLGDRAFQAARLVQCIVDAATLIPIWIVARRLAPRWAAAVAACGYALLPEFVRAPTPLLAEALIPFPIALAVAAAALWEEHGRTSWLLVSGLAVGAALLLRSEVLVLAPLGVVWVGVIAKRRSRPLLLSLAAFGGVVAIVYGPWVAWRLKQRMTGQPLPSAVATTVLSGLGQYPNRFGLVTSDRFTGAIMHYHGLPWHLPAGDAYAARLVADIACADPWLVIRSILRREVSILTGVNLPNAPVQAPARRANGAVLWIALAGGLYALTTGRIRSADAWLAAGPALLYCATLGLLYYEARYVVPAHISLLWLGTAVAQPQPCVRRRLWVPACLLLVCGVYAAGWALESWRNRALAATRPESATSAAWQPERPSSWPGATVSPTAEGGLTVAGRRGTRAMPGFAVTWENVPIREGEHATVLVELEVVEGSVVLAISQTLQFPNQAPERLWLVREQLARPGRYTVLLPIRNFTGRGTDLVLLPGGEPKRLQGNSQGSIQCRVYSVQAWSNAATPSRPLSLRHPAASSAS